MPALNRLAVGVLTLALGAPATAFGQMSAGAAPDAIDLEDWDYGQLYAEGWLGRRALDAAVLDAGGEEIGTTEDLLVSRDGQLLAVVAEIGGILDIGDEHVAVPWDVVELTADGITLPVTEGVYGAPDALSDADDAQWQDAWRATDLLDDNAMFAAGERYGVVLDFVFDEAGTLLATVVGPDSGGGYAGVYAVPFRGVEPDYRPDEAVYVAPAALDDVMALGTFDPTEVQGVRTAEGE